MDWIPRAPLALFENSLLFCLTELAVTNSMCKADLPSCEYKWMMPLLFLTTSPMKPQFSSSGSSVLLLSLNLRGKRSWLF